MAIRHSLESVRVLSRFELYAVKMSTDHEEKLAYFKRRILMGKIKFNHFLIKTILLIIYHVKFVLIRFTPPPQKLINLYTFNEIVKYS